MAAIAAGVGLFRITRRTNSPALKLYLAPVVPDEFRISFLRNRKFYRVPAFRVKVIVNPVFIESIKDVVVFLWFLAYYVIACSSSSSSNNGRTRSVVNGVLPEIVNCVLGIL